MDLSIVRSFDNYVASACTVQVSGEFIMMSEMRSLPPTKLHCIRDAFKEYQQLIYKG